jgi:hypothetical protein
MCARRARTDAEADAFCDADHGVPGRGRGGGRCRRSCKDIARGAGLDLEQARAAVHRLVAQRAEDPARGSDTSRTDPGPVYELAPAPDPAHLIPRTPEHGFRSPGDPLGAVRLRPSFPTPAEPVPGDAGGPLRHEATSVPRPASRHEHGAEPPWACVEVDVVPFGDIQGEDRTILWPDDHRMNVRGLSEAMESAERVLLPGGLDTRVPGIPALALLKLLTWWDRRASTTRDAIDLATMIDWYSSGEYLDRLYDDEIAVLARHDFDPAPAGAWLLGSHMPGLLDHAGVAALLRIVEDEDTLAQLANDTRVPFPRGQVLVKAMGKGARDTARLPEGPA